MNSRIKTRIKIHRKIPFGSNSQETAVLFRLSRKDGRVVDCTALERRHTEIPYRGFESLSFRQLLNTFRVLIPHTLSLANTLLKASFIVMSVRFSRNMSFDHPSKGGRRLSAYGELSLLGNRIRRLGSGNSSTIAAIARRNGSGLSKSSYAINRFLAPS